MKISFSVLSILLVLSCSQKGNVKQPSKTITPKVLNIYPSSDTLPENLLRFYIQFSHSMRAVNNLENIKLIDERNTEVEGAIFNNVHELWDPEQKQLTLILDPSRVKTGLVVNEGIGRALKPDKQYQLIIEKAVDIDGNLLEKPYSKTFFVTNEDKNMPNLEQWNIKAPKSNSSTPLVIDFTQILDRQSAQQRIHLLDEQKNPVAGKIDIINNEKSWIFKPKIKWKKGTYTLHVNGRLEDPSGNNMNGLFDHKIGSLKNHKEGEVYELIITIT